jgi:hypothetical protein
MALLTWDIMYGKYWNCLSNPMLSSYNLIYSHSGPVSVMCWANTTIIYETNMMILILFQVKLLVETSTKFERKSSIPKVNMVVIGS